MNVIVDIPGINFSFWRDGLFEPATLGSLGLSGKAVTSELVLGQVVQGSLDIMLELLLKHVSRRDGLRDLPVVKFALTAASAFEARSLEKLVSKF